MNKKWAILLLLIIIALLAGFYLLRSDTHSIIEAEEGVVDLGQWNNQEDGIVRLNGEWAFYWKNHGLLDEQQKEYITVPATWKNYPGHGYGTYKLEIKNAKKNAEYAIDITTISTAYNLWIDGKQVASIGTPGKTKETTTPLYQPQEVYFTSEDTTIELIFQVSNFHYRDGGIWETISFGTKEQIQEFTYKKLAFEMIIFGCLLLAGLYHVVLFALRRQNKSAMYFSLVCFIVCLRIVSTEDVSVITFFPQIPWNIIVKLEYLSFYTSVPLFCWVLYTLYPNHISKRFCRTFSVVSALFISLVLVTTPNVFTYSNIFYQSLTLVVILYMTFSLIMALKAKQEGSLIVNICVLFLSITVINDILSVNSVVHSYKMSSIGLSVFIFSQSYIIANRSSIAYLEMERVTDELALLNRTLEDKVRTRTISLESSRDELEKVNIQLKNLSYQDQLTQIPNRRYFDEIFEQKWKYAIEKQIPIAVIYFDLDFFKMYNDTYGHEAGDKCLIDIAVTIKETIKSYDGHIARLGGEEFIAVLYDIDQDYLASVCETCREAIESLEITHESSPITNTVTVSIGAAIIVPDENLERSQLVKVADESLYQAKDNGRNQFYITYL